MANEAVLTAERERFDSVAKTANQAIASALNDILDRLAADVTGDMARILSNIQNYMGANGAPQAFEQMSEEIYTTYPEVGAVGMHRFVQAVNRGLSDSLAQEGRQGWFSGYGPFGKGNTMDGVLVPVGEGVESLCAWDQRRHSGCPRSNLGDFEAFAYYVHAYLSEAGRERDSHTECNRG